MADYGKSILHLAYSYLRNRADAEDVLQDTMVQLLRKAPEFESDEHEKAWLLRVAANLCKNRLRTPWRRYEQLPEDYPADGKSEESLALLQAVGSLPVKYREVVHLFYYEDASTAQIAAYLGAGESAVRKRLSRARAMLRKQFQERGRFDEAL
ncbi:sigma-70 family RNA polymerase sigma factor [Clostridiales bacterium BX7]|uniref:Sigma-70 family RNA polymerase sigma factor n=1 Tax=Feifania hominis TaxID=2763660 RepID=A0A926DBY1_9FIRM|nr:sigma-70 family RNA polymerase sigma factor [Feifania hominis]MBC8535273.1 sigma-70 family RNA polymerase sigma factor [Feifania hominis]